MDNEKEDRIRVRAYEIWQRTGRQDGSHIEHWDQATREIEDEDAERDSMATEQVAGAPTPEGDAREFVENESSFPDRKP